MVSPTPIGLPIDHTTMQDIFPAKLAHPKDGCAGCLFNGRNGLNGLSGLNGFSSFHKVLFLTINPEQNLNYIS